VKHVTGFSLTEMAVVLATTAFVISAVLVTQGGRDESLDQLKDDVLLDQLADGLVKFAAENFRLPCPDTDGDGYENAGCLPEVITGLPPFLTLGVAPPSKPSGLSDIRAVYAVYRGGGDPALDLTRRAERSSPAHVFGDAEFQSMYDLKRALVNAASAAYSVSEPTIANDSTAGAVCAASGGVNQAFVVALAGLRDADKSGSHFDGINMPNLPASAGSGWNADNCFERVRGERSEKYDDAVTAVGFLQLLGHFTG
jgi:hypothetical protein